MFQDNLGRGQGVPHPAPTSGIVPDELGVTCAALDLDPLAIANVMSVAPARIAGIADRQGNSPRVGVAANLCFVDLNVSWMVNPQTLASKSTNTPFVGRQLRGKVAHTMFNGNLVVRDGEALK